MHEMSLAMAVLQIVEDAASEQRFQRVKTVFLEIGELAAVEPEAMRFCFDAVIRGTLAEGAVLKVIEVAGEGLCFNCIRRCACGPLRPLPSLRRLPGSSNRRYRDAGQGAGGRIIMKKETADVYHLRLRYRGDSRCR
jgi:hydrogenase nickel insertion protein HypA